MKISVLGAGNAGCFSAVYLKWNFLTLFKDFDKDIEIEIIYDPDVPPVAVGQATLVNQPKVLSGLFGCNWYNSQKTFHPSPKLGILYENFGTKNRKLFHEFPMDVVAMHFCPHELQDFILDSGLFTVTKKRIVDYAEVDADYVIDCRGTPKDFSNYTVFNHPVNSVLLARPNWNVEELDYSKHVATPDGWAFVIPSHPHSPARNGAVGYNYNSLITSKEDATKNLKELFDVEVTNHINYKNYVANNPFVDDRILLNGNKLLFLEPMESNSIEIFCYVAHLFSKYICKQMYSASVSYEIHEFIDRTRLFILWHYLFGSIYNTPFWGFASSYSIDDPTFNHMVDYVKDKTRLECVLPSPFNDASYALWKAWNFRIWYEGMTKSLN